MNLVYKQDTHVNFHDKFIVEFENAFSHDFCDRVVEFIESDKSIKSVGATGGGVDKNIKNSIDIYFDINVPEQSIIATEIIDTFRKLQKRYSEYLKREELDRKTINKYNDAVYNIENIIKMTSFSNPQLQKIGKGGYYHWHSDIAPKNVLRVLSYIVYLNDLKPEDGGCTSFTTGKSVRPQKGKVLMFPAETTYIHRGDVVKNGTKYIINCFSILQTSELDLVRQCHPIDFPLIESEKNFLSIEECKDWSRYIKSLPFLKWIMKKCGGFAIFGNDVYKSIFYREDLNILKIYKLINSIKQPNTNMYVFNTLVIDSCTEDMYNGNAIKYHYDRSLQINDIHGEFLCTSLCYSYIY